MSQFTTFESMYLDYNSPDAEWFNDDKMNQIGFLQIYVDDMLFPVLGLPLNLAKMIRPDNH